MALRQCIVWDNINIVTKLIKFLDQGQGGWAVRHGFFYLSYTFHQSFLLLFIFLVPSLLVIHNKFAFDFFFFFFINEEGYDFHFKYYLFYIYIYKYRYIFSHKFRAKNITLTSFMPTNIAVSNTLYIEINKNISHNGLRFC